MLGAISGQTQISGGTFQGGNGFIYGGDGLTWFNVVESKLLISGGTFQGGTGERGEGGNGATLGALYLTPVTISGGTFIGGSATSQGDGLVIYGASNLPPMTVNITGGSFSGSESLRVEQYSGSISISGGDFSGLMSFALEPTENEGNLISFYGTGFNYNSTTGFLTGTLDDGNKISTHIIVDGETYAPATYGYFAGGIRFYSIPEPSSIVTLATGLLGLAAAAAYRRRRLHRTIAA